jgi:hypothetical protein
LSIIIGEQGNPTELPSIGEGNGLKPSAGNAPTPEVIVNNLQLDQQTSAVNDADNIEISRRLGSEDDLVVKTDEM